MLKTLIKPLAIFLLTILTISTIQWASIQFLANYCSYFSFKGFINNFVYLGSPLCLFVNNIQSQLSNYYVTIWISTSTSLLAYFGIKVMNFNNNLK